jgi:hypothetical protein
LVAALSAGAGSFAFGIAAAPIAKGSSDFETDDEAFALAAVLSSLAFEPVLELAAVSTEDFAAGESDLPVAQGEEWHPLKNAPNANIDRNRQQFIVFPQKPRKVHEKKPVEEGANDNENNAQGQEGKEKMGSERIRGTI